MLVALCFWGLSRSLKYTKESLENNILKPLKNNNIEYIIYFHTYYVKSIYTNVRAGEYNIELDNDEYKLLESNYIKIDDQDSIKEKLQLKKYRTHRDPWFTNYKTLDNFILAMYSKQQLWYMIENSIEYKKLDKFIFLRPDVKYLNMFDINWLHTIQNNDIYVPEFHYNHNCIKFNDRMAICEHSIAKTYCNVFDLLYKISLKHQLHSETIIRKILIETHKYINIKFIKFYFNRVRANGKEQNDCTKLLNI